MGLALAAGAVLLAPSIARPQDADCNRLYAAIQAADGAQAARWSRAAEQQRSEIARTRRYADQLGCGGLDLFGSAPPQCAAVQDRLQRMEDNLERIQSGADQGTPGGGADRQALVARYNAQCVAGGNPADLATRAGQFFDGVFGHNPADPGPDQSGADGVSAVPPGGDILNGDGAGQSLGQAICVRSCDGGWFPLGEHATQDRLSDLSQLCQASCPNTEAKLYTMRKDGELSSATGADGTAYTDLPAAFKFEKSFEPTCTCKPPGQSWVQALAEAEKLLNTDRHDVTVTVSLSDEMAKPGAPPPTKNGKVPRTAQGAKPLPLPDLPDLSMMRDGQKALQAPTASNATTGIGGPVQPERLVREGMGPTVSVKGPDGVSREIRLIVP